MASTQVEHLIIGGGPTGLGAAWRFEEEKSDWLLLEAESSFGGLAGSFVDDAGFTWDYGGHVQFSHYETFDRYMRQALGDDGWLKHQRESWVWIRKRFAPYPFQNNLHRLDAEDRWACVEGLLEAAERQRSGNCPTPQNFEEWILATFGPGVAQLFMQPYNFKVWAYSPSTMDYGWIGERVSVPKMAAVLKSICTGQDEVSWGPNSTFSFPKNGGTGAIWKALGEQLPESKVQLGARVTAIDVDAKKVHYGDGDVVQYKHLISSVALNHLIQLTGNLIPQDKAEGLIYSSTNIIGVGLNGEVPDHLRTKCWMYFPESNSPYYRVTVFSNYSPNNTAKPGEQWSLMAEIAESSVKPVRHDSLQEETLLAMEEDGLIPDRSQICSVAQRHIPQGYPTPFLGRDELVDPMLRTLEEKEIYSRGRFGAWKYEVSNQDHSFAQGYECAGRLVIGGDEAAEPTLFTPSVVNSQKNP